MRMNQLTKRLIVRRQLPWAYRQPEAKMTFLCAFAGGQFRGQASVDREV